MTGLGDNVYHIVGREKLPLFDVYGFSAFGAGADKVRLPAKKGRRLQNVNDGGHFRNFGFGVNVG